MCCTKSEKEASTYIVPSKAYDWHSNFLKSSLILTKFSHLPQPDLPTVRLWLGLTQCFTGNCPAGV